MTGLVIFTVIAMAGCAFLIYFMYALWQDSRSSRRIRVEIRKPPRRTDRAKVLYLFKPQELREVEKKRL